MIKFDNSYVPTVNISLLENKISAEKDIQCLKEHCGGTARQNEMQAHYKYQEVSREGVGSEEGRSDFILV